MRVLLGLRLRIVGVSGLTKSNTRLENPEPRSPPAVKELELSAKGVTGVDTVFALKKRLSSKAALLDC